jgi:deoxyribonuclease-4
LGPAFHPFGHKEGDEMALIGSNVPTVGGLPRGFEWAGKWGCECIQVYLTLSRQWNVPRLDKGTVDDFRLAWRKSEVKEVIAHVPFLVNLASPDVDLWKKSVARLTTEVTIAQQLGVRLLVLHPGSFGRSTKNAGVARIIDGLKIVIGATKNSQAMVLLETMAGQGSMIGSQFEDLRFILDQVGSAHRLGICLDTAHVFEAGYNLRGYGGLKHVLEAFNDQIGLGKLKAIHLNDSLTDLGSRVDRHAAIGCGKLGLQVFHALMTDTRFEGTPAVLEEPDRDTQSAIDLQLLRALRKRKDKVSEPRSVAHQSELLEV